MFRSQIFFLFLIINISLFSQGIKSINEINQDFKVFSVSDSNKLNPLKFSVQIGEFNKLIDSENPISKYPLLYFKEKNSYKYFVGNYYNYSSAQMMSKMLINDGLDKAFIICFGSITKELINSVNTVELEDSFETDLVQDEEVNVQESEVNIQDEEVNVQESEVNIQDEGANIQESEVNIQDEGTKNLSLNSKTEYKVNSQKIRIANKVDQDFQVFPLSDSNKLTSTKFSIQIGAFKNLIGLESPISKYQPLFYFLEKNIYKYFVVNFEDLSSAISTKNLLVQDGLSDPHIVCFDAKKRDASKNSKNQSETLVYRLGTFVENDKINETETNYIDKSSDIDEKIQKLRSLTTLQIQNNILKTSPI